MLLATEFSVSWPVAIHNCTALFSLPLARVLPSRLNAIELTSPAWPLSGGLICWPVATFHSWIVPSESPLARVLPSGLNAIELTSPAWPLSAFPICWPVAAFHSQIVPS